MTDIGELRPLTAGQLLDIRQRTSREDWEPEERALRRNAAVLAACCFREGERVFADAGAALEQLTVGEMETLLSALLRGGGRLETNRPTANASFGNERFCALREES